MGWALVEKREAIATIIINRPDQHNALDIRTAEALEAAARDVAADDDISVVILRGAGRAFCSGGDVVGFAENMDNVEAHVRALLEVQHRFILTMTRMPKISIAAVHGSAAGAGLSLAAMCDMCVAEEDVRFVPAFASLGLSPDSGGTFSLSKAVGSRRALQLFMARRSFSAIEAHDWGLVTSIAPTGDVAVEAERLAETLVATGPQAIAETKRLISKLDASALEDQLGEELESIVRCLKTPRFQSAVRAFMARKAS